MLGVPTDARPVRPRRSPHAFGDQPVRRAGDDAKAFCRRIEMRTLVGVSLTVAPPLGQYDDTKVINLGTNRWSVKPEIGLSRACGPLGRRDDGWASGCSPTTPISPGDTHARRIRSRRHRPI